MLCHACWSTFEEWERENGRCPYCFPRQIKRVRKLTDEELEVILEAGCPNCHVPWKTAMGVYYCDCNLMPPSLIRFQ